MKKRKWYVTTFDAIPVGCSFRYEKRWWRKYSLRKAETGGNIHDPYSSRVDEYIYSDTVVAHI